MTRLLTLVLVALTARAHAQAWAVEPPGPAPERTPQPGTVPVVIGSVGSPLHLSVVSGTAEAMVDGYHHSYPVMLTTFRPLCDTPCTLYLSPGVHALHVGGYGIRPHVDWLDVSTSGADLTLRAPSMSARVGGFLMIGGGLGALAGGIMLVAMGKQGDTSLEGNGFDAHFVDRANRGEIIGGGILAGVGIATMAGGIALLATNQGGVASSRNPQQPTAKISAGLGTMQVAGTF